MPNRDRAILEQHRALNALLRIRFQELEAENTQHLADLKRIRSERDGLRIEAAELREDVTKLNEELALSRNKYNIAYEDLERRIAQDAVLNITKAPGNKLNHIDVRSF